MQILFSCLLLGLGIVLVVYGGEWFVKSSLVIAKKTKIPEIVIGVTIVSFATTLPELIVSVISAASGSYGLSVGNVAGTVICNTALICGVSLSSYKLFFDSKEKTFKYYFLIAVNLLFFIFCLDMNIGVFDGLLFLIFNIVFFVLNTLDAKSNKYKCDSNTEIVNMSSGKTAWLFILGIIGIGAGAVLLVKGAIDLARLAGISETFIGLLIVGFGTSIPELATAISAIKRKAIGLTIGNIIGANIINITMITGICGIVSGGLPLSLQTLYFSVPVLILASLILVLPIIIKRQTYKWQGISLLVIYILYVISLIIITIFGYVA